MNARKSLTEELDELGALGVESALPQPARLDAIRAQVASSLTPVRPLPSNNTLVWLAVAVFIAFSALATIPVGFAGFHRLLPTQKLLYLAVILLSAAALSKALVNEILPGSKRHVAARVSMLLALVAVALVTFGLFPTVDFDRFSERGLPCLELGTVCAALSGCFAYFLIRKGFSSSPLRTGLAAGLLAGLAGFAILALHCPVLNVAHILVWHFGAVLIGAAGGLLLALARPVWQ